METPAVRALAAKQASLAADLALAALDSSPLVRREVAANAATEADVLVLLARDRDWRTRAAVAARRDAPAAAHLLLVHDRAWRVTCTLGDNPSVDVDVWRVIATEGPRNLRAHLAGQRFVPLEIARLLLSAVEAEVRRALASRTPHREVLQVLLSDPHPGVRSDALSNSLVTNGDVDRAVQDRDHLVRGTAARHLPVRSVDLDRLLQDRSEYVRAEAADRRANGAKPGTDGRLGDRFRGSAIASEEPDSASGPATPSEIAHWPTTPLKPTMKWFKLFAHYRPATDEIPAFVARLWKVASRVNRDPAWMAWWEPAPYRVLDISYGPVGPPGNLPAPGKHTLYWSISFPVNADLESAIRGLTEDAADQFFTDWTHQQLETALEAVTRALGLPPPPALSELT